MSDCIDLASAAGREMWRENQKPDTEFVPKRAAFARWFLDADLPTEHAKPLRAAFYAAWVQADKDALDATIAELEEGAEKAARAAYSADVFWVEAFDHWWLSGRRKDNRGVRTAQIAWHRTWREMADGREPLTWAEWVEAARKAGAEARAKATPEPNRAALPIVEYGEWFADAAPSKRARNALAFEFYAGWDSVPETEEERERDRAERAADAADARALAEMGEDE